MRPLPSAPPPERTGRPPGASLSMPPSGTNSCASPTRAEAERLEPEVDERREAVVELGQVDVVGPEPGRAPTAARGLEPRVHDVVERPVRRQPPGGRVPGRVAGDVHRAGAAGRCARSAEVNTNAATPSTGMSQSNRQIGSASIGAVEVLLGAQRPLVPVRPRDARAVLARLDDDRRHRFACACRTAAGTRCTAARSSPAGRSSPAAPSTARCPAPRASGCRGSCPAGLCSARCIST